jgi:transcriptional regulator with XRE-family HTH domain
MAEIHSRWRLYQDTLTVSPEELASGNRSHLLRPHTIDMDHQPSPPADRVGDLLRQARLEHNWTLEDVTAHTRISRANLLALEESDYQRLPADFFTKGLLQLYAEYLGIDDPLLADRFFRERDGGRKKQQSYLHRSRATQSLQPKKLAEQARVSSATAAIILLTCIVVSFTGFCLYFSWNPFEYVTDKLHRITSTVKSNFHPADPTTSGIRNQNKLALQAVFHRDCRVLVILDDHPGIEQNYLKGSTIQWEAHQGMVLYLYQADCAELQFNGTPLPFPPLIDGRATIRLPIPAHAP